MWVRSPTLDHGTYIVTSPCMAYALRPRIHLGHFWNLDTFISPNLSVGPLVWDHEGWLRHKRQRHNVLICLSRESRRQSSYQVAFRSHFGWSWTIPCWQVQNVWPRLCRLFGRVSLLRERHLYEPLWENPIHSMQGTGAKYIQHHSTVYVRTQSLSQTWKCQTLYEHST